MLGPGRVCSFRGGCLGWGGRSGRGVSGVSSLGGSGAREKRVPLPLAQHIFQKFEEDLAPENAEVAPVLDWSSTHDRSRRQPEVEPES